MPDRGREEGEREGGTWHSEREAQREFGRDVGQGGRESFGAGKVAF